MKVFICLSIFFFMLATCQGKCFSDPLRPLLKDGNVVKPNTCVDRYDGKSHPIWSSWRTAHCFVCDCRRAGMRCCERERGLVLVERCKKGENPESCKDGAFGVDDKCRLIIPIDGKVVKPNTCVDRYDGKSHPIWSSWSTAHCFVCDCSRAGMRCCERIDGVLIVARCEKRENTESYEDGIYRLDEKCRIIVPVYKDPGLLIIFDF